MLNIEQILKDYGIYYDSSVNPGWLNINCPFCRDSGKHLGLNLSGEYSHCWKCGGHRLEKVFQAVLHLTPQAYQELIGIYNIEYAVRTRLNRKQPKAVTLELPGNDLNPTEKRYLQKRGFNPDFLAEKYGLRGGGIVGRWKFRIIIPVLVNKQPVSFTSRDITGKQQERYKNLPVEESVIDPKTIFYNVDNANGKRVCVVEGPTDTWRMGDGFICSLGTSVTPSQINFLSRYYEEIFLMFDPEPEAQKKAQKYAEGLAVIGKSVWKIDIEHDCDPGDLTDEQAEQLRRELGFS
jgi:hypothetical protein